MNQQPGVVIWRGKIEKRDAATYRVVLHPGIRHPHQMVTAEQIGYDATGSESWSEASEDDRDDILEQAIHDLVAALQQAAPKPQAQPPSVSELRAARKNNRTS